MPKQAQPKNKSQFDKFKAMAKELGTDGDETALDRFLKRLPTKVMRLAPTQGKKSR